MKKIKVLRYVLFSLASLCLLGYLVLFPPFTTFTEIDLRSGMIRTVRRTTPFSISVSGDEEFMELGVPYPLEDDGDWCSLEDSLFRKMIGLDVITTGDILFRERSRILGVISVVNISQEERIRIILEFRDVVRQGGVSAASDYSVRISHNLMERDLAQRGVQFGRAVK